MDQPAHTPLPWRWSRTTHNTGTGAMEGDLILITALPNPPVNDPVILAIREDWTGYLTRTEQGKANAALIVTAVNAFEELKSALKALVKVYDKVGGPLAVDLYVDNARALLARLEGTQ